MKTVNTAVDSGFEAVHQTASPVVCTIIYRKDIHNEKNTLLSCMQQRVCYRQKCQKVLLGKVPSKSKQSICQEKCTTRIFVFLVRRQLSFGEKKEVLLQRMQTLCQRQINKKKEGKQSSCTNVGAGCNSQQRGRLKLRSVRSEVSA